MRRAAALAMALWLGAGCAEVDQETSPEVLAAALVGLRGPEATTRATADPLPSAGSIPHVARQTLRLKLVPTNGELVRLVIARTIERGEGGRFHLRDSRVWQDTRVAPTSAEDGAEVLFDGKRLALRRDGGPWMERETLGGQEDRLLRSAYDLPATLLAAFGPYLVWSEAPMGGPPTVAGMDVRWEDARLDPQVRPRPMNVEAQRALRDTEAQWEAWLAATHRPTEVRARVARRVTDGQVVSGSLALTGEATVEDLPAKFELGLDLEVGALPADQTFAWPDAVLPAQRDRPWKRIREILGDDLLPAYRGP